MAASDKTRDVAPSDKNKWRQGIIMRKNPSAELDVRSAAGERYPYLSTETRAFVTDFSVRAIKNAAGAAFWLKRF